MYYDMFSWRYKNFYERWMRDERNMEENSTIFYSMYLVCMNKSSVIVLTMSSVMLKAEGMSDVSSILALISVKEYSIDSRKLNGLRNVVRIIMIRG